MVLFQNAKDKSSHFHGAQSIFHFIKNQTKADQLQKTEEVRPPSRSKDYSLIYPLYIIHVPEIYDLKYQTSIVLSWKLKLHKLLRTKITFVDFQIYQVFGFCPYNASIISISLKSSKISTYCGVMSMFNIYPPDFEVLFELHIGNMWYVKLDTTFDLISANIIENYKLEDNIFYKSVHVYHLRLIMTCIVKYKIVVEKYQKIILYTQLPSHNHATIYNGPGYLTQKTIVQSKSQLVVINSFQFIVELITQYAENRSDLNRDFLFTYSTKLNDFYTEVLSEKRLETSISFASKRRAASTSTILFTSPEQSSVNVTILRYRFQGVYDPSCPFGAVSFFEYSNLQNITEIKSICSSSHEGHFQNVYSSTGSLLIVFYAYRGYGSLNVTVNVSYTRCQSVRIQSCILFEICLQHYNLKGTRQSCWKDQQYTLRALRDKRLKTNYPQIHIFGHAPSEDCIILQMINDPQSSHPQHTHLYHKNEDSLGCSFYLNFKTSLFNSVTTWWSFRITGFFSHPSRFHIVKEPHSAIHENLYNIDNQGDRSKCVFDYDNCSNNIRNIKPTPGKDVAIDLVHYENFPENLLYFVYFNLWTKDNINPSWLGVLVTIETNVTINSEHLVILNKIPYEFNRIVPSSDQFIVLSLPQLRENSSILLIQAETDHTYFSAYKIWGDREYLVVHWEKIYHMKENQKRIVIALPGATRKITAQNLDENNLILSFKWTALPEQMNVRFRNKFCKQKLTDYPVRTTWTGYHDFRVECHLFKMPLNYYLIQKFVPHLPKTINRLKYNIVSHLYLNSLVSCVNGSRKMTFKENWIEAAKTCKSKGMTLPEFLSRRDQEELLYLLETTSIFPVKAVFIGLHGSSGQV